MDLQGAMARVDVVVLLVQDVETSKAFYRDVLGRPVKYEDDGFAEIGFENMSIALEEHEWAGRRAPASGDNPLRGSHFHFTVWVDDVDQLLERFADKLDVAHEPTDQPKYGQRTAFIRDPDGNLWELSATMPSGPGR